MADDTELLRRYVREKSEAAFAEFVRRHLDLVYSAAWRRMGGNAQAAADVAQEVFLSAARRAAVLEQHPSVTGWLYTATRNAAHNLMRNELRRKARERAAQADTDLLRADGTGDNWEQLRPVLDAAMDELSARDREAVLLRFFEGRALADVGARLGLSDNAARMRVERALDKLRDVLARRGLTSTTAALGLALANQAVATAPAALAGSVTAGALAGGGAAGAGWIAFMASTKLQLGIAATLVAAGTLTVGVQSRDHARVAEQIAALQRDQPTLDTLRQENQQLARREEEVALLRADDQEYARLQAEAAAAKARLAQAANAEAAARAAKEKDAARGPYFNPNEVDVPASMVGHPLVAFIPQMLGPGVRGEVVVDFIVEADGRVLDAEATGSTHEELATATVAAVKKTEFKPAQKNGAAVRMRMRMPFVFSADEGRTYWADTDAANLANVGKRAPAPSPKPGDRVWPWF